MSEDKPTDLGSAGAHDDALALARLATEQRRRCAELSSSDDGKTINVVCENLIARAQANERKADRMNQTSQALKIREEAARVWNRNAPRDSELAAASKAIAAAGEELKRAANADEDTTAAQHAWNSAVAHSADLTERRKQADADYKRAEQRAKDKLAKLKGRGRPAKGGDGGGSAGMDLAGDGKAKSAPQAKSALPSTTPAKSAAGAAAPRTTATSTPNAAATATAHEKLSDLLRSTGQIPQQQPQAQQPTAPQAPAQPATLAAPTTAATSTRPDNRKSAEDALGHGGLPDVPDVSVVNTPSATAPSSAAATSTAQHTPATSGTSAKDLHTDADVTGRSEGPRTVASGATSKLTNTTGYQGSAQPQTAAAHTGMGQPGFVPGAGTGSGPATSKGASKIHTAQNKIEHEPGVVPGGTIAQNRPDRDDDK